MEEIKPLKLKSPCGQGYISFNWDEAINNKLPSDSIMETIRWVCKEVPVLKSIIDIKVIRQIDRSNYADMQALCDRFNHVIDTFLSMSKGTSMVCGNPIASNDLLKWILEFVYTRVVSQPVLLNKCKANALPETYGETNFEQVRKIIQKLNIQPDDTFIDLGSGIGHIVLQVAASTPCRQSIGIEKESTRAEYAIEMDKEFKGVMKWFGKKFHNYQLLNGDFLDPQHHEAIYQSTIIFVNNFAFREVNHKLKGLFGNLDNNTRIVSTYPFRTESFRVSDRNLDDPAAMMKVSKYLSEPGAFSWTPNPVPYYIQTIDRCVLQEYFDNKHINTEQKKSRHKNLLNGIDSVSNSGDTIDSISETSSHKSFKTEPSHSNESSLSVSRDSSARRLQHHHPSILPRLVNQEGEGIVHKFSKSSAAPSSGTVGGSKNHGAGQNTHASTNVPKAVKKKYVTPPSSPPSSPEYAPSSSSRVRSIPTGGVKAAKRVIKTSSTLVTNGPLPSGVRKRPENIIKSGGLGSDRSKESRPMAKKDVAKSRDIAGSDIKKPRIRSRSNSSSSSSSISLFSSPYADRKIIGPAGPISPEARAGVVSSDDGGGPQDMEIDRQVDSSGEENVGSKVFVRTPLTVLSPDQKAKAKSAPAYLPELTRVSTKVKGTQCRAMVKKVEPYLKVRIRTGEDSLSDGSKMVTVNHTLVEGTLEVGASVKFEQDMVHKKGTIEKIWDNSLYTIEFDDGDRKVVRRSMIHVIQLALRNYSKQNRQYGLSTLDKLNDSFFTIASSYSPSPPTTPTLLLPLRHDGVELLQRESNGGRSKQKVSKPSKQSKQHPKKVQLYTSSSSKDSSSSSSSGSSESGSSGSGSSGSGTSSSRSRSASGAEDAPVCAPKKKRSGGGKLIGTDFASSLDLLHRHTVESVAATYANTSSTTAQRSQLALAAGCGREYSGLPVHDLNEAIFIPRPDGMDPTLFASFSHGMNNVFEQWYKLYIGVNGIRQSNPQKLEDDLMVERVKCQQMRSKLALAEQAKKEMIAEISTLLQIRMNKLDPSIVKPMNLSRFAKDVVNHQQNLKSAIIKMDGEAEALAQKNMELHERLYGLSGKDYYDPHASNPLQFYTEQIVNKLLHSSNNAHIPLIRPTFLVPPPPLNVSAPGQSHSSGGNTNSNNLLFNGHHLYLAGAAKMMAAGIKDRMGAPLPTQYFFPTPTHPHGHPNPHGAACTPDNSSSFKGTPSAGPIFRSGGTTPRNVSTNQHTGYSGPPPFGANLSPVLPKLIPTSSAVGQLREAHYKSFGGEGAAKLAQTALSNAGSKLSNATAPILSGSAVLHTTKSLLFQQQQQQHPLISSDLADPLACATYVKSVIAKAMEESQAAASSSSASSNSMGTLNKDYSESLTTLCSSQPLLSQYGVSVLANQQHYVTVGSKPVSLSNFLSSTIQSSAIYDSSGPIRPSTGQILRTLSPAITALVSSPMTCSSQQDLQSDAISSLITSTPTPSIQLPATLKFTTNSHQGASSSSQPNSQTPGHHTNNSWGLSAFIPQTTSSLTVSSPNSNSKPLLTAAHSVSTSLSHPNTTSKLPLHSKAPPIDCPDLPDTSKKSFISATTLSHASPPQSTANQESSPSSSSLTTLSTLENIFSLATTHANDTSVSVTSIASANSSDHPTSIASDAIPAIVSAIFSGNSTPAIINSSVMEDGTTPMTKTNVEVPESSQLRDLSLSSVKKSTSRTSSTTSSHHNEALPILVETTGNGLSVSEILVGFPIASISHHTTISPNHSMAEQSRSSSSATESEANATPKYSITPPDSGDTSASKSERTDSTAIVVGNVHRPNGEKFFKRSNKESRPSHKLGNLVYASSAIFKHSSNSKSCTANTSLSNSIAVLNNSMNTDTTNDSMDASYERAVTTSVIDTSAMEMVASLALAGLSTSINPKDDGEQEFVFTNPINSIISLGTTIIHSLKRSASTMNDSEELLIKGSKHTIQGKNRGETSNCSSLFNYPINNSDVAAAAESCYFKAAITPSLSNTDLLYTDHVKGDWEKPLKKRTNPNLSEQGSDVAPLLTSQYNHSLSAWYQQFLKLDTPAAASLTSSSNAENHLHHLNYLGGGPPHHGGFGGGERFSHQQLASLSQYNLAFGLHPTSVSQALPNHHVPLYKYAANGTQGAMGSLTLPKSVTTRFNNSISISSCLPYPNLTPHVNGPLDRRGTSGSTPISSAIYSRFSLTANDMYHQAHPLFTLNHPSNSNSGMLPTTGLHNVIPPHDDNSALHPSFLHQPPPYFDSYGGGRYIGMGNSSSNVSNISSHHSASTSQHYKLMPSHAVATALTTPSSIENVVAATGLHNKITSTLSNSLSSLTIAAPTCEYVAPTPSQVVAAAYNYFPYLVQHGFPHHPYFGHMPSHHPHHHPHPQQMSSWLSAVMAAGNTSPPGAVIGTSLSATVAPPGSFPHHKVSRAMLTPYGSIAVSQVHQFDVVSPRLSLASKSSASASSSMQQSTNKLVIQQSHHYALTIASSYQHSSPGYSSVAATSLGSTSMGMVDYNNGVVLQQHPYHSTKFRSSSSSFHNTSTVSLTTNSNSYSNDLSASHQQAPHYATGYDTLLYGVGGVVRPHYPTTHPAGDYHHLNNRKLGEDAKISHGGGGTNTGQARAASANTVVPTPAGHKMTPALINHHHHQPPPAHNMSTHVFYPYDLRGGAAPASLNAGSNNRVGGSSNSNTPTVGSGQHNYQDLALFGGGGTRGPVLQPYNMPKMMMNQISLNYASMDKK